MTRRAQPWLGTLVEITSDGDQRATDLAFAAVALVHRLMSFHDPGSEISRFNLAPVGARLPVHPATWRVLQLAEQVQAATDGVFNVACAPQLVAWGCLPAPAGTVGPAPRFAPTAATQQTQPSFACQAPDMVDKLADAWLDVGGIAKGYAVDAAVAALQQAGAQHGCVNAGGDLRVFGARAWPVALRDPRAPQRLHSTVMLRDAALATSASYFSERTWHGQPVSALVDGRDGAPLVLARSVSVRAPLCAVADALTKLVAASGKPQHPALTLWQASAFII